MKLFFKSISILFTISLLSTSLYAQYGPQFDNTGFEQWTTREENSVSEPVHWHSGGTATGTYSGFLSSQIELSTQKRPGSTGIKSVRLFPSSVLGVTANGSITNGRINAGSMSASGSNNYNYTQRAQNAYNTPISQVPDSLTVWACFRSQSTSDKAQVKAVVHGDADYRIIADGTESPSNMHVATATMSFTRTAAANGSYTWRRLSIPFNNNGPCTDVRYILLMATTNENPGSGSTNDDLFLDDVLLVYNPTLSMGQLASTSFQPGNSITIPFTLTGTMSPDNLNMSANNVIAQLSDANGNFNNPTELGRVTTNTSGSITAQIPNVSDGQNYRIRVVSTNYPMIGQNIQQVSITSPSFTVTVTANPTDGGTVTGSGTYSQGASCTVAATANTGYTFSNWTENGNVVSTNASYTFTVEANRSLVANFTINTYTITASANPNNGGTVSGGGTFNYGQNCTVAATANTGYTFTNWTENGNVVSTNASYTFTVEANRNLVANFTINSYTVNVSADPTNGGSVTGGGTFNFGQSCTVSATANAGYTFTNWTENGTVVSNNANYTFTVQGNRNLVAHFTQQNYTISLSANPNAGGTLTGDGTYHHGDNCTAVATPNYGYTFVNWTENGNVVSTSASYTFTVEGSRNLVANFQTLSYTITVDANPSNGGTVDGGGEYSYGETCTVRAITSESYTFINWTENGSQVSAQAEYTFIVEGDRDLVANFSAQSYIITAVADPEEGGILTGSGGYDYGDVCTLTATANTGYTFSNWTKDDVQVSTDPTYTFTVTGSETYVAHFTANSYTISVTVDPIEGGVVSGDGTYDYGQSCTLTATANEEFIFVKWTKDGVQVSTDASYTFIVRESEEYVAHFQSTQGVQDDEVSCQIFPNPFTSKVSIKAERTIKSVGVYDIFGRLVKGQNVLGMEVDIDLSDLSEGAYLLQLDYGDSRSAHRIIKITH